MKSKSWVVRLYKKSKSLLKNKKSMPKIFWMKISTCKIAAMALKAW